MFKITNTEFLNGELKTIEFEHIIENSEILIRCFPNWTTNKGIHVSKHSFGNMIIYTEIILQPINREVEFLSYRYESKVLYELNLNSDELMTSQCTNKYQVRFFLNFETSEYYLRNDSLAETQMDHCHLWRGSTRKSLYYSLASTEIDVEDQWGCTSHRDELAIRIAGPTINLFESLLNRALIQKTKEEKILNEELQDNEVHFELNKAIRKSQMEEYYYGLYAELEVKGHTVTVIIGDSKLMLLLSDCKAFSILYDTTKNYLSQMNLNNFNYYDISRLDQTDNLYVYLFSDTELSSVLDSRISESIFWLESERRRFVLGFIKDQEEPMDADYSEPEMDADYFEPEYGNSNWGSFDWGEKFAIDPDRAEAEMFDYPMYKEEEDEKDRFSRETIQARINESGAFKQCGLNIDAISIVSCSRRFMHPWSITLDHLKINSLLDVILFIPSSISLAMQGFTGYDNDSFLMKSVFWEVSKDVFLGLIYNEIYLITLIVEPKDIIEYWMRYFNCEFFEVKDFEYASSKFHVNWKMYSTRKAGIDLQN